METRFTAATPAVEDGLPLLHQSAESLMDCSLQMVPASGHPFQPKILLSINKATTIYGSQECMSSGQDSEARKSSVQLPRTIFQARLCVLYSLLIQQRHQPFDDASPPAFQGHG